MGGILYRRHSRVSIFLCRDLLFGWREAPSPQAAIQKSRSAGICGACHSIHAPPFRRGGASAPRPGFAFRLAVAVAQMLGATLVSKHARALARGRVLGHRRGGSGVWSARLACGSVRLRGALVGVRLLGPSSSPPRSACCTRLRLRVPASSRRLRRGFRICGCRYCGIPPRSLRRRYLRGWRPRRWRGTW